MKRKIAKETQFIHFSFEMFGQHHYPGHPTLGTPHCHKFSFQVLLETFDDRGIEFIAFRHQVCSKMRMKYLTAFIYNPKGEEFPAVVTYAFDSRSCETLAEELVQIVTDNLPLGYPEAEIQVSVFETEERAGGLWKGKILAAES